MNFNLPLTLLVKLVASSVKLTRLLRRKLPLGAPSSHRPQLATAALDAAAHSCQVGAWLIALLAERGQLSMDLNGHVALGDHL